MSRQVLTRVLVSLHRVDTQDMSEHIGACPCPYFSLFDTMWMPRTRASMLVLVRVLISLSSTPCGCTGHERAHQCSPTPCVSLFLSLRLGGAPRTQVSTLVLARVLISLSSPPCLALFMSLRHHGDTQDTSEHTGARLCPYLTLFNAAWMHRT